MPFFVVHQQQGARTAVDPGIAKGEWTMANACRPLSWLADNFTAGLAQIAASISASQNFCGQLRLSVFAA